MRYTAIAILFAIAAVCPAARADEPAEIPLFNGKDLSNWRSYQSDHKTSMEDVWSVKDGLIVCTGEPIGYLYTRQFFTNFRLKVEYRWPEGKKPGNSGIFTRINGKPLPLPRCFECQLKSGDAGHIFGFWGMKLVGDPARLKTKENENVGKMTALTRLAAAEKEPGQWNAVEILEQGGQIKIWMNGQLVNETTDAEVIAGPVGLQSEGGEVHFRNVVIAPLP